MLMFLSFQADIDKAVKAAKEAFKINSKWRTMDASQRGAIINKFADLMERDIDYLAVCKSLTCKIFFSSPRKCQKCTSILVATKRVGFFSIY